MLPQMQIDVEELDEVEGGGKDQLVVQLARVLPAGLTWRFFISRVPL